MRTDSETVDALRRAGRRVVYHLLRAGIEGLKAVEAVVDELGHVGRDDQEAAVSKDDTVQRIEVE